MMFILGFVMYGTTVLLPIQLQSLMGYTAEWAGWVLSPGGIMTLLMMPLVGRLLGIFQPRWLVIAGLIIVGAGMFRLSTLNLTTDFRTFVTTWTISRTGMPLLFIPINVAAFAYIPREKTNNATGLINLTRNLGGSVGISLVTAIQSRFAQVSQNNLIGNLTPVSPAYNGRLEHLQGALEAAGATSTQAAAQAHAIIYGEVMRQSAMLAYIDVFRLLAWVCVAMIPLMFFMRPAQSRAGASAGVH
jgi:DHA2 family multidrug resistance protein